MYNLDTFVNSNPPVSVVFNEVNVNRDFVAAYTSKNINLALANVYDKYEAKFLADVVYDSVNTQASPVHVYEKAGKPVAWYDTEMYCGYIAE